MRIAVSGATGLIGAAVARRLSLEHDIVSLGRRSDSELFGDFSDPAALRNLNLFGFDAVVHCGGVVDEDFLEDPRRAFLQATEGMAAFVARARDCGVEHFASISSAHVYGPLVGSINEETTSNPLSDYAIAHFASEQILRRNTGSKFRGAVFRPCAVFGVPHKLSDFRRWSLIPFEFPLTLATSGRIVLKSSGQQRRNFVGTRDIAASVARWLSQSNSSPMMSVINPVGKESMSVWAFAQLCERAAAGLVGLPISIVRGQQESGTPSASLDFQTIHPEHRGSQDLFVSIRELIKLLVSIHSS